MANLLGKNADCWNLPHVVNYFNTNRNKTEDIYPSEWLFIKNCLREGMSVLDIGCAQGGFARILGEYLEKFEYTGLDISEKMIDRAKKNFPQYSFYHVQENDFSILGDKKYDLVIILGILHLHESWRNTIKMAWQHTKKNIVFDLRETYTETIEDKTRSYFTMMNKNKGKIKKKLPYNIINTSKALKELTLICKNYSHLSHYGYEHAPSEYAVIPFKKIFINTYCIAQV